MRKNFSIIGGGLLIGVVFCIINMIISLKTGLGFGGEQIIVITGGLLLYGFKRYNVENINTLQATACGAFLAMFAMDSAVVALIIYKQSSPSIVLIAISGIMAVVYGFIIAYLLSPHFIQREKLAFPIGKATASAISSISGNGMKRVSYLLGGIIVSALVTIPVYVFEIFPDTITLTLFGMEVPEFIGVAVSPMLLGLGFLIGTHAGVSMICGAIFSVLVWFFVEGRAVDTSYSDHLNNQWIMSVSISLMLVSSFVPLVKTFFQRSKKHEYSEDEKNISLKKNILLILLFIGTILSILVVFYFMTNDFYDASYATIIVLIMSFIGIVFCCNSSGKTGLTPITPIGIISFVLIGIKVKDFQSIMLGGAFVCAISSAAVTMLNTLKTTEILKQEKKAIFNASITGGVIGVIAGTIILFMLIGQVPVGGAEIPAPVSITWGAVVESVFYGSIPKSINLFICAAGILLGGLLGKTGLSVLCIGVGVMISPCITVTIFIGGIIKKILEKTNTKDEEEKSIRFLKCENFMTGLIIGEGVAVMLMLIKMTIG